MSRRRSAVDRMAAQAVPADEQLDRVASGAARDLARVLGQSRLRAVPDRGPGHRRWGPALVVGVVVTAVLAAVAVFVLPGPVRERPLPEVAAPAPALTPVVGPAEVLRQLADRAAAQPDLSAGAVDYVHVRSGVRPRLDSGLIDGSATRVDVFDVERWSSPDRNGRTEEFKDDEQLGWYGDDPRPRPDLPADPADLEQVLVADSPRALDEPSLYFALEDVWAHRVMQPQQQASILRLLATKDGIRVVGQVADHLGREGVLLTVAEAGTISSPFIDDKTPPKPVAYEHRLLFDPRTGGLLEIEHVVVEGADGYVATGPRPQSEGWTAWVGTDRVDEVGERP